MAYALGLPDALRRRGLPVEVVPGWETRSAGSFNPRGAVCHWTAGPRGTTKRASLGVVTNGRPGLSGPLCNVYLDRNGIAVVIAAGRANHAGTGGWKGLSGNSAVFGTEAEAAGPDDWTPAQRRAYPKVCAAYCDLGGFGADMVCGHSEWAGPRKTDINGYPMAALRADTAAILAGGNTEEDFMAKLTDQQQNDLYGAVDRMNRQLLDEKTARRWMSGTGVEDFTVYERVSDVPANVTAWPTRPADVGDIIGLIRLVQHGDTAVLTEITSAFHQEADRDAAAQAFLQAQLATIGATDPAQLIELLRAALGEQLAADVAARLTVTAG